MPTMEDYLAGVEAFRKTAGPESLMDNHSLTKINPYGGKNIDPDAVNIKIFPESSKLIPDNLPTQAGESAAMAAQAAYLHKELSRTDIEPSKNPVILELVGTARDVASQIATPTLAAKREYSRQTEFESRDPNSTRNEDYKKPKSNILSSDGKNLKDLPEGATEYVAETLAVAEARIALRKAIEASPDIEKNHYTKVNLEPDITRHAVDIATEKNKEGKNPSEPNFDSARTPEKDGKTTVKPEFEAAWKLPEAQNLLEKVEALHERVSDHAKEYNATHNLTPETAAAAEHAAEFARGKKDFGLGREDESDHSHSYEAGVNFNIGDDHSHKGEIKIEDLGGDNSQKNQAGAMKADLMKGGLNPEETNMVTLRPLEADRLTRQAIDSMPVLNLAEKEITEKAKRNYYVVSSGNEQSDLLKSYINNVIDLDADPKKIGKMTNQDWKEFSAKVQEDWNNPKTYTRTNVEVIEKLDKPAQKAVEKPDETLEHIRTREGADTPVEKHQHIQMTDLAQNMLTLAASGRFDMSPVKEKAAEIEKATVTESKTAIERATETASPEYKSMQGQIGVILERDNRNPEIAEKNNRTLANFSTLGEIRSFGKTVLSETDIQIGRSQTDVSKEYKDAIGPQFGERTPEQEQNRKKIEAAVGPENAGLIVNSQNIFTPKKDLSEFGILATQAIGIQPHNTRETVEAAVETAIGDAKKGLTPKQEETREKIQTAWENATGKKGLNFEDPKNMGVLTTAASYAANDPMELPFLAKVTIINGMANQGYDPKWGANRRQEAEKESGQNLDSFMSKTDAPSRLGRQFVADLTSPITQSLPDIEKIAGKKIIETVVGKEHVSGEDIDTLQKATGNLKNLNAIGTEISFSTNLKPTDKTPQEIATKLADQAGLNPDGSRKAKQTEEEAKNHQNLKEISEDYGIPSEKGKINLKVLSETAAYSRNVNSTPNKQEEIKSAIKESIENSSETADRKKALTNAIEKNDTLIPGQGRNTSAILDVTESFKKIQDIATAGRQETSEYHDHKTLQAIASRIDAMTPQDKENMMGRVYKDTFAREDALAEKSDPHKTVLDKKYVSKISKVNQTEQKEHQSLSDFYRNRDKVDGIEGQIWFNNKDVIKEHLAERLGDPENLRNEEHQQKHKPMVSFIPPETPFGIALADAAKEAGYVVIPGRIETRTQTVQFTKEKETIEGAGSNGAHNEVINAGKTKTNETTLVYKDHNKKDRVFNPDSPPWESARPKLFMFDPHGDASKPKEYGSEYTKITKTKDNKDIETKIKVELPTNAEEYTRIAMASTVPGSMVIFADSSRSDSVPWEIAKAHRDIKTNHSESLREHENNSKNNDNNRTKTQTVYAAEIINSQGAILDQNVQKRIEESKGNRSENVRETALKNLQALDPESDKAMTVVRNIIAYGRANGVRPTKSGDYIPTPEESAKAIINHIKKIPDAGIGSVIKVGMNETRPQQTLPKELAQSFKILPPIMIREISESKKIEEKISQEAQRFKLDVSPDRLQAQKISTPNQDGKTKYALIGDPEQNTPSLHKQVGELMNGLLKEHGRDEKGIANFTIHTTLTPGLGEAAVENAQKFKVPVIAHSNLSPHEIQTETRDLVTLRRYRSPEAHIMDRAIENAERGLGGMVTTGSLLGVVKDPEKIQGVYLPQGKSQILDEGKLLSSWGTNGPTFKPRQEEEKKENLRGILIGVLAAKGAVTEHDKDGKARSLGEQALEKPEIASVVAGQKTVSGIRDKLTAEWAQKKPEFMAAIQDVTQNNPVAMRNMAASIHSVMPNAEKTAPTIDMTSEKNIPEQLRSSARKNNIVLATTEQDLEKARNNGSAIIQSPFRNVNATHENEGILKGISLEFGNGKTAEPITIASRDPSITRKAAALDSATNVKSQNIKKSVTFTSITYENPKLAEGHSPSEHFAGFTAGVKEALGSTSNKEKINTPSKEAGYEQGKRAGIQALIERPDLKTHTIGIEPSAIPKNASERAVMLVTMNNLKKETATDKHPVEARKTDFNYTYEPEHEKNGISKSGHTIPGTQANAEKMLKEIAAAAARENKYPVLDIRPPQKTMSQIDQTQEQEIRGQVAKLKKELLPLTEPLGITIVSNVTDLHSMVTDRPADRQPKIFEATYKTTAPAISSKLTPSNLIRDTIAGTDAIILGSVSDKSPAIMAIMTAGEKKPIATLGPAESAAKTGPENHSGTRLIETPNSSLTKVLSMNGSEAERNMPNTTWERAPSVPAEKINSSVHAVAYSGRGAERLESQEDIAKFSAKAKDANIGLPTTTLATDGEKIAHPEKSNTKIAMIGGLNTATEHDDQQIETTLKNLKNTLNNKLEISTTLQPGYNEKVIEKATALNIPVTVHSTTSEEQRTYEQARMTKDLENNKNVKVSLSLDENSHKEQGVNTIRLQDASKAMEKADGVITANLERAAPELAPIALFGLHKPVAVLAPEAPGKENAGSNMLVHPTQEIQAFLDTSDKGETTVRTGRQLHSYPEKLAENTNTKLITASTGAGATMLTSPEDMQHLAGSITAIRNGKEVYSLNGETHAARTMDPHEYEAHNEKTDPSMIRYKMLEQVVMDRQNLTNISGTEALLHPGERKLATRLLSDVESLDHPNRNVEAELEAGHEKTKAITNARRRARQKDNGMG